MSRHPNIEQLAILRLGRLEDDPLELGDADLDVEIRAVATQFGLQMLQHC